MTTVSIMKLLMSGPPGKSPGNEVAAGSVQISNYIRVLCLARQYHTFSFLL